MRGRRCWSIIVVLGVLLGLAPAAGAAGEEPGTTRYVVGFHQFPSGLAAGQTYGGARVVLAESALRFAAMDVRDPDVFLAHVRLDPNLRYVEEDPLVQMIASPAEAGGPASSAGSGSGGPTAGYVPNDPQYGAGDIGQYGPRQIGAAYAWNVTRGSTDAAVCIVDTGILSTHEDFVGGRVLEWADFVNGLPAAYDDHGHGTHVAGIAAATIGNSAGIAGLGNVGIYAAKVLDANGEGPWTRVAAGIRWCADRSVAQTVINISIWESTLQTPPQALADAVTYAYDDQHRLLVAIAGNGACDDCISYPARYSRVIAVTCNDLDYASCSYSSKGSQAELSAPGDVIISTYNDYSYAWMSGTSMSAPHVSGALALAWSHDASMTYTELRARAQDTARDLGTTGRDEKYGFGLVDANCVVSPVPYPVRNVTAAAGPSAGQIKLGWTAPYQDCNSPVTKYKIYRSAEPSTGFTLIATLDPTLTYTDSGLGNGATRYYRIRPYSAYGTGPYTTVPHATTYDKPGAPQSVAAQPGTASGEIAVSWDPPASDGGKPVTGYYAYRADSEAGTYARVATLGASASSWTDTGRTALVTYWYKVSAKNLIGEGAKSPASCSKPFPSVPGVC